MDRGSYAVNSISLDNHETLAASVGDRGPTVVLVHGLGLDWRMWRPVMDQLARGRRVIAYDLRGDGEPFTMTDAAADLFGVLDAFDVPQAHVVGLSFGGAIAQTAAVTNPGRFASLSLLATTDIPFAGFENRARSAEVDGMAAQLEPSLSRWFTASALAADGAGVRYAREQVLRGSPAAWAAAWRAFSGLDVRGRLADFPAPALVLAGEADVSTTPELMRQIAAGIPGSTFRELPAAPHMQTLECPDAVAAALDEFLPQR
ncbi:alpha/beta fold hydrolase [Fodinicola acaciae]|uniref:alpha/beta fold hydrolase n=1 Tax=Fodinicola acaciae TaxID=2681555 RepID=UPI0013D0AFDF|nr:alpha/beta fold hydrolase [Fodinicola acaciae]